MLAFFFVNPLSPTEKRFFGASPLPRGEGQGEGANYDCPHPGLLPGGEGGLRICAELVGKVPGVGPNPEFKVFYGESLIKAFRQVICDDLQGMLAVAVFKKIDAVDHYEIFRPQLAPLDDVNEFMKMDGLPPSLIGC